MRWILTWKNVEEGGVTVEKKAKARIVLLGYQDPELCDHPSAAPTVGRTLRQLFFQACALRRFRVSKGDVSAAFLQGREMSREVTTIPVKELAERFNLKEGEVMHLRKAAYGLVQAPREWYETVASFLRELGYQRILVDHCCWARHNEDNVLISIVVAHVDDFMIGGEGEWHQQAFESLRAKLQWGEWESKVFTQCGLRVTPLEHFNIILDQEEYTEQMEVLSWNKSKEERPVTEEERTQLRGLIGAMQWRGQQSAPGVCPGAGLLASKVTKAATEDLREGNLQLKRTKERSGQQLVIHSFEPDDELIVATWVDAAHDNREDGGSTGGIIIGMAPKKILDGEECGVSAVYWSSRKAEKSMQVFRSSRNSNNA